MIIYVIFHFTIYSRHCFDNHIPFNISDTDDVCPVILCPHNELAYTENEHLEPSIAISEQVTLVELVSIEQFPQPDMILY